MRQPALSASSNDASLAAEAYSVVRRRILRGEISLGQSVSRRKVAAELGMSFLPVSEALLRLEFEGLLESRPRAGTRVRIPSPEDVRGHYLVREILEAEAARLFAQVATRRERAQLMKMAARVDELSPRKNRAPYLTLHHKLHSRIAECARCAPLSAAIEQTCALSSTWFCLLPRPAGLRT
ncbi:MAG TPA: GntR family transcriptional regulator, partial [Vicinamibacterales bacterium]|nr:GntR family transcriptional regulator [Vicinamibacterales bacterium]